MSFADGSAITNIDARRLQIQRELERTIKFRIPRTMRVAWVSCKILGLLCLIFCLFFCAKDFWVDSRDSGTLCYRIKAVNVKVGELGRKIDDGISLARKEFGEKKEKKGHEMLMKLKGLDARIDVLEKEFGDFHGKLKRLRNIDDGDGSEF